MRRDEVTQYPHICVLIMHIRVDEDHVHGHFVSHTRHYAPRQQPLRFREELKPYIRFIVVTLQASHLRGIECFPSIFGIACAESANACIEVLPELKSAHIDTEACTYSGALWFVSRSLVSWAPTGRD